MAIIQQESMAAAHNGVDERLFVRWNGPMGADLRPGALCSCRDVHASIVAEVLAVELYCVVAQCYMQEIYALLILGLACVYSKTSKYL